MKKSDSIKDYLLAGSTQTPPVKLSRLAHSRYSRIRCRVAENPAASTALLLALSGDSNPDVRIAVANNPRIPRSLLVYLVADENSDVRYALAENYDLSPSLLQRLSRDENPYVADRALKSLAGRAFFKRAKPFNFRLKICSSIVGDMNQFASITYSSKAVLAVPIITRGSIPTNSPFSITPIT